MSESNESFDASQYKVLCVDDEPNILSALRRMLSLEGFEVFTAESGALALEQLAKQPVNVIISDMQMPGMNGTELLEKVRQQWPQTMRLMLTGASDVSGAIEAIIDQVLAANQKSVEEFRSGKEKAFNALVGQIMKASQGKANPGQVNELLRKKLS